jgi:ribosome assembly protein YihI (activator of Der GTPase)
MTQNEREQLERDYTLYLYLLDYYAKNRNVITSMTDKEYQEYIDAILDEINHLRKLLEDENKNTKK